MKRFLSAILCVCLLLSNFTFSAFAETTPILSVEVAESCLGGDTITATVKLENATDYTAISYRLQYDSEKMTVVSATGGTDFSGGLVTVNPEFSENEVFHSFTGMSAISTSGTLLTVEFKVNNASEGDAEFTLTNLKLKDINSAAMDITAQGDSITITANPIIIKPVIESENANTGDNISFTVETKNLSDYSAISYRLQYDSEKMTLVSATGGTDFSGGLVTVNPEFSENEVFHSYTGMSAISTNGTLLNLEFTVKDNVSGDAEFTITNLKVKDVNSSSIDVEAGTDKVAITCTHKDVEWEQTKDPKCNEEGLKEFSCGCGYYDSETIETIDHNYETEVVAPTKTQDGYTNHACSMCRDNYQDTVVPALGFTVEYDANGGAFTGESQNKRPDSNLTLTSVEPTRTGYTFKGWATSNSATVAEYAAGGTYDVNEDVKLYAVWEINKYKLIYKVDGNTYKEYEVEYNSTITAEAEPTKTGYTFSGWSAIPSTMPDEDVTVTGSFTINKHKLTYKVDGSTYKEYEVEYNSTITAEAEPTKTGYTFSGWSAIPSTMPDEDVTVTGSFTINKHKLTYKVDGNTYKEYEVEYNSTITAEAEPTKTGYTFSGWSTIPSTMPDEDVTITGTFSVNKHDVIYIVDGIEYDRVEDVAYGTIITLITPPAKIGYIFSGWSVAPTTMPDEDVTITGSFTKGDYKIIYKVDGEVYKEVGYDYGATITPEAEPTKVGHTFSGWGNIPSNMPAENVTVSGTFIPNKHDVIYMVDGNEHDRVETAYGTSISTIVEPTKAGHTFSGWSTAPATMPDEDVTITGTFTVNRHDVIYKVDGEEYEKVEATYGATITPIAEPTKTGYTFSGWSAAPSTMPDEDVIITGTFTVNTYKVFYKVDGEDYKSVDVNYGTNIPTEAEPVKTGYTFSGWSVAPTTMPAENVTVTGTFTINQYTLKYMVDGSEYLTRTYDYNELISSEIEPEKDDYVFNSWENLPLNMPAENVTVNAKWTRAYSVSGVATFNGVIVSGITVEIAGKNVSTDAEGKYNIVKILPGTYTLKMTKGVAEYEEEIVIGTENVSMENVDLVTLIENISIADSVKSVDDTNNLFSNTDKDYVSAADTNSVTYALIGNDVDFDGLANIADVKASIPSGYKDSIHGVAITVDKTMVGTETGTNAQSILNGLVKITIELPESMRNQSAYSVVRTDGTSIDVLTTEANTVGEKILLEGNNIVIYTQSTGNYGVVYKQRSSSRGGSSISRVATVKANVTAKEVVEGTKIVLTTTTKDASIYYTVDGTEPSEKSTLYDGPITLTEDTIIRAIATKKGMSKSIAMKVEYTVRKAEVGLSENAKSQKYIDAYEDDSFKPDQAITRYEVVESLNNVFDIEKTNVKPEFTDVSAEYKDLVDLFAGASIINGYEDNTFKGTRGITRGELVKILSIMLGVEVDESANNAFSDDDGHWAEGYINSFVKLGYILGYPDGSFKPDNNITRAEFVIIVNRITQINEAPIMECIDLKEEHWAFEEIMKAVK